MKDNSKGYILILSLVIAIALFIYLGAVMTRFVVQRKQIDYSYHKERALALAESGIDVALSCLNEKNLSQPYPEVSGAIPDMGTFLVTITSSTTSVTITSTGYSTQVNKIKAERTVEVTAELQEINLFNYSLFTVQGPVQLNDSFVDSYDSRLGSYEDQATNYDPGTGYTYANSNASVGTGLTDPDAISLNGNSMIFGDTNLGVKVELPQPVPPASFDYDYSGTPQGILSISGNDVYKLNNPGTYRYDAISISGNGVLEINAPVTIYVAGDVRVNDLDITGHGEIRVATGSTVNFYVGGNLKIAGNGIVNLNSDPSALAIYGTQKTENIQFQGNAAFRGLIYAPYADVTVKGSTPVLYGAVVANSIDIGPNGEIHYDEAIRDKKNFLPSWASIYRIVFWKEK